MVEQTEENFQMCEIIVTKEERLGESLDSGSCARRWFILDEHMNELIRDGGIKEQRGREGQSNREHGDHQPVCDERTKCFGLFVDVNQLESFGLHSMQ